LAPEPQPGGSLQSRHLEHCRRDEYLQRPVDDFWHLHNFDWLSELSVKETEQLRRRSVQREYRAAEMIFIPAPHPHSVYLLERGLVRIYRVSSSGAETTFGYVRPGEIFGELAAFSRKPRESFAKAVRTSFVWQLPREAIQEVLAAHPGIAVAVTTQVGSRLKRIESRVEHLVFRSVRSRVVGILLELAEDFGRREPRGLVIDLAISQQELATLVGASRQTVNASLRELERAGLIRGDGRRFVLLGIDALRRSRDAFRSD
jgi:CRP/FNR family transcriptional regulator, cyclic AMP receptor protein